MFQNESKADTMTVPRMIPGYALAAFSLTILLLQAALPSQAHAASIKGSWRGAGVVTSKSGARERVRCRVTYGRTRGKFFSVNARCASSAGQFNQSGTVKRVSRNRYVGTVYNTDYNVRGRVVIRAKGKRQSVSITSSEGKGYLSLRRR